MKRDILKIDEELCNGCGLCVPNCYEGALQVIDGKVRLVSELMCDGLGACIGHCPEGAITIEQREAEPYDEIKVMEQMISKGRNTIIAHLKHLKDHGEKEYLKEGVKFLNGNSNKLSFNLDDALAEVHNHAGDKIMEAATAGAVTHNSHSQTHSHSAQAAVCPGSRTMVIDKPVTGEVSTEDYTSELRQWPVQMHLINPNASYFRGADLLLAADCVAYSVGGFHNNYLKGRSLAIACPKLDHGTEIYIEKLKAMIDVARINTITVMVMEVPCCSGLLQMVKKAVNDSARKVHVKLMVAGIAGEILKEERV